MKRKNNLYKNIYQIENIKQAYKEVCKNTRNQRRVALLKDYEAIYIYRTYSTLVNKRYKVGSYNSLNSLASTNICYKGLLHPSNKLLK
ncbi:MAG: hypothetical protein IKF52_00915 [Clostridia bacterium]|nr:hypothetical protein [Clostridia bacterium]